MWNDYQRPVIFKGTPIKLGSNSDKPLPTGKFPCRVWKGRGDDVDKKGSAITSVICLEQVAIRHDPETGVMEGRLFVDEGHSRNLDPHSTRPSLASPVATQTSNLGYCSWINAPLAPLEVLGDLPLRLHRILEKYYTNDCTHQPPVCASDQNEEHEATLNGHSVVFLDLLGQEVAVKRFATGFRGYIFLMASRNLIINHRNMRAIPKEHEAWCGNLELQS